MALISLNDISIAFGDPALLESARMEIGDGERICLLGLNHVGKSTLTQILAGEQRPDAGDVSPRKELRIALLRQDVPTGLGNTTRDVVCEKVPENVTGPPVVDTIHTKMDLDGSTEIRKLSVGIKRRTLLARALATQPDLLLLNEPTNHLEIKAILWMEDFLLNRRGALCFITHGRALTQRLATHIVEIVLGGLHSWNCDYLTYLKRRQAQLEVNATRDEQFDRKLSEEEAWTTNDLDAETRSR
jgi:ATP-binding cassette subfamily F protein uup